MKLSDRDRVLRDQVRAQLRRMRYPAAGLERAVDRVAREIRIAARDARYARRRCP